MAIYYYDKNKNENILVMIEQRIIIIIIAEVSRGTVCIKWK